MDNLKSAFIGVITHELRSPFANIDFSVQLLERHGLDRLPPEQRDPLEQIVTGIRSAKMMAFKFTDAGGKVWIRCWDTADAAHFEVKDTGVDVPADKLSTLWEGFTQMADPLRRGVERLGLGLALVKYVVGAHGGQVWVHSEVGVGSTFGFQVPLRGPENQSKPDLVSTVRLKD